MLQQQQSQAVLQGQQHAPVIEPKPLYLPALKKNSINLKKNMISNQMMNGNSIWSSNPNITAMTASSPTSHDVEGDPGLIKDIQDFFSLLDLTAIVKSLSSNSSAIMMARQSQRSAEALLGVLREEDSSVHKKILAVVDLRVYSLCLLHNVIPPSSSSSSAEQGVGSSHGSLSSDHPVRPSHLDQIKLNNSNLITLKGFSDCYKNIQVLMVMTTEQKDRPKGGSFNGKSTIGSNTLVNDIVFLELNMLLDIMYMLLCVGSRLEKDLERTLFTNEIAGLEPPLIPFLFSSLEKLAEGSGSQGVLVQKLSLILCKSLDLLTGGLKGLDSIKEEVLNETIAQMDAFRTDDTVLEGEDSEKTIPEDKDAQRHKSSLKKEVDSDPAVSSSINLKVGLQEFKDYRCILRSRYPSYYMDDPSQTPGFDFINPNSKLEKMCEQYYLISPPDASWTVQNHLEASRYAVFDPPYLNDPLPPIAIQEGDTIMQKHFIPSAIPIQIEMERKRAYLQKKIGEIIDKGRGNDHDRARETITEGSVQFHRIRKVYENLYPILPSSITILVRLLFYLIVSSNATSNTDTLTNDIHPVNTDSLSPAEKAREIARRDGQRHKEIVTSAIAHMVILIVKLAKRYHALAFEYVCTLLVDNNAPILILKMLSSWFANPALQKGRKVPILDETEPDDMNIGASWLIDRPLLKELDFFYICHSGGSLNTTGPGIAGPIPFSKQRKVSTTTQVPPSDLPQKRIMGERNLGTTLTLLAVLHKLTKGKVTRIQAMVQWKAQAVLKRILKIKVEPLTKPVLKLLKSQIPYLGKKWRANNMYSVSLIYMHASHRVREEYLCGDGDIDATDAQTRDAELRDLVSFYNNRIFGSSSLVNHDEEAGCYHDPQNQRELAAWLEENQIPLELKDEALEIDSLADTNQEWINSIIVDELDLPEMDGGGGFLFQDPEDNGLMGEDSLFSSFEVNIELESQSF